MRRIAAILGVVATVPAPAMAQAYQCVAPRTVGPVPAIRPDGPPRRTAIGGYTLAASWSPDYCKTSGDTRSMQCNRASGRFGFILHGLWPEAASGPSPQWCAAGLSPSPQTLRAHLCMTPSARLLVHEWAKHGSCMSPSPQQYYHASALLWRAITWPDADRLSRKKDLTVGDLRSEFVAANPQWPRGAVGVALGRTGWLRELRLCYRRDFMPAACPPRRRGPPDSARLKIWRGL